MRAVAISSALAAVSAVAFPPVALADSVISSNWSGYAAHASGVTFRRVSGTWQQPAATCTSGALSSSTIWVGLGGYGSTSDPIEQIGTELDCAGGGRAVSSAWYEIAPRRSDPIRMIAHPGDRMLAVITATRTRVTLQLYDLTRKEAFLKRVRVSALDRSSAEWIVEAPSWCGQAASCQTRPLTNFGSVQFRSAQAQATGGSLGSISDPLWTATRVVLVSAPLQQQPTDLLGVAAPLLLESASSSFQVDYSRVAATRLNSFLSSG